MPQKHVSTAVKDSGLYALICRFHSLKKSQKPAAKCWTPAGNSTKQELCLVGCTVCVPAGPAPQQLPCPASGRGGWCQGDRDMGTVMAVPMHGETRVPTPPTAGRRPAGGDLRDENNGANAPGPADHACSVLPLALRGQGRPHPWPHPLLPAVTFGERREFPYRLPPHGESALARSGESAVPDRYATGGARPPLPGSAPAEQARRRRTGPVPRAPGLLPFPPPPVFPRTSGCVSIRLYPVSFGPRAAASRPALPFCLVAVRCVVVCIRCQGILMGTMEQNGAYLCQARQLLFRHVHAIRTEQSPRGGPATPVPGMAWRGEQETAK